MKTLSRTISAACLLSIAAEAPAQTTSAPAAATLPSPAVETAPVASRPAPRTKFEEGEPVDAFLTELALRYDVIVLRAKPIDAILLRDVEMPGTLNEAVEAAQKILEPQGLGIIRSVSASGNMMLKVSPARDVKEAAQQQGPVTFGKDHGKIDINPPGRHVTHLLPIEHTELIESFRRTAQQDKDVEVNLTGTAATGYSMILTGPALKVQRAVEAVVKLDTIPAAKTTAKIVTLLNIDAREAAANLNAGFARENNGLRATADIRTNSVVITGPEDLVPQAAVNLTGMDGYTGVRPNLGNGPIPTPFEQPRP